MNNIRLLKFTSGLLRTANTLLSEVNEDNTLLSEVNEDNTLLSEVNEDNTLLSGVNKDNTKIDLFIAEDKSFIIYEKNRFPLSYVRTVYFGDPKAESTKANIRLAQRDVSMRIIYRVKERDLSIILYHDGESYKFSHITFSNREFR